MKVLIVAKTRQGKGACIGGITFAGESVRLIAPDAEQRENAGMEYNVGDVWQIDGSPAPELTPPHVENIIVASKRKLPPIDDPTPFIQSHLPPLTGGLELLYDGLTQATDRGTLYIAERTGVPANSTLFWQPNQPLKRDDDGKRIRYRYPTADGGRTLTFVGFQEPLAEIAAGTLLRVSLAHWWRPADMVAGELRCYVQLSGWFMPAFTTSWQPGELLAERMPASPPQPKRPSLAINEDAAPLDLLQMIYGYNKFRPLQAEIIENIRCRQDTLIVMPTGGGKSLCYQLPALLFDGLTVVVSPLISLMQNQVSQLRQLGVPALFLNSTLDYDSYVAATHQVRQGQVKLLYVAPETLLRPETLRLLEQSQLDCLAIDEAHCISAWGHDFRPEYRKLLSVRQRFPQMVCMALTATATPRVREDIKQTLQFREENSFVATFDRPNLFISIAPKQNPLRQAVNFLAERPRQSGIIYCTTRKRVAELYQSLVDRGISTLPYHAGMTAAARAQNQERFIRDDVQIMVATIAFGMGIDKPDVRFVLHVDLPKNIEAYYQQIGRAGRDGLRADCLLLYSRGDVQTIQYFIGQGAESERRGRQLRLEAMVRWAEGDECRRQPLLDYFGEEYGKDNCGMCDNCTRPTARDEIDLTIAAQKFLSCVKRTGEIFGMNHVIKVLRRSQAQDVLRRKHHKLSTYGIGTEFSREQWKELAGLFIRKKLVVQDLEFGSLKLTPKAYAVFKGEQVMGPSPGAGARAHLAAVAETYNMELFELLRAKRKMLADESNVPPYAIFSDRTLREMCTFYPQAKASFAQLHGVGKVKLQQYAGIFLPIITSYCRKNNLTEQPMRAIPRVAAPTNRLGKARYETVGEAFVAGETVTDLAEAYGVKRQTIIAHLGKYVEAGEEMPASRLQTESSLSTVVQDQVLTAFAEHGAVRLRLIFDVFEEKISYEELHLMRVIYYLGNP